MATNQPSISAILMKLLNSLKIETGKTLKTQQLVSDVAPVLIDEALKGFKQYAKAHGIQFDDTVIDVKPLSAKNDNLTAKPQPLKPQSAAAPDQEFPKTDASDWFTFLRQKLSTAVVDLAKSVNLESVGRVLNTDLKTLFGLDARESALVDSARRLGESIGVALDRQKKFPVIKQLAGQIAALLSAMSCKMVSNRNLIIETEFARQNLESLMAYGVRYEQLTALADDLFENLNRLDRAMGAQIAENEALKAQVRQNIADAHARVTATIHATDQRLTTGMDAFDADVDALIDKL